MTIGDFYSSSFLSKKINKNLLRNRIANNYVHACLWLNFQSFLYQVTDKLHAKDGTSRNAKATHRVHFQRHYIQYSRRTDQCTIATVFPEIWQNENLFIHTAGIIHLFKYMKLQMIYKLHQCIVIITKIFEYHHEAGYLRAGVLLRALDLDKHVLIVLYASFI